MNTRITRSIQKIEYKIDRKAERFIWKHPFLGFLSLFVGMPIFILLCVCISSIFIALPMMWIFGCY